MPWGEAPSGSYGALLRVLEPAAHRARVIQRIVGVVRERLGLEVSFVSEFAGGLRMFRFVDGDAVSFDIEVEAGDPLEETYCQRIVDGTVSSLIRDTDADATTRALAVTEGKGLGAYSPAARRGDGAASPDPGPSTS